MSPRNVPLRKCSVELLEAAAMCPEWLPAVRPLVEVAEVVLILLITGKIHVKKRNVSMRVMPER